MKAIKFNQFELAIALCGLAANAFAASPICVANTNDSGAGSLRAAITQANEAGGGEITFCITNTITLLSALPSLTANITLAGPGTNLLTISGGNQVPVFSMNSGTTNTLSGLTIANGMAQGYYSNGYVFTYASGISNAGSLKLLNCVVQNCSNAFSYGVGIYNAGGMDMEACVVTNCGGFYAYENEIRGGGIYNSGTLQMTNCRISCCHADVNSQAGGGICNTGNLTMSASVIESCRTGGEGDGGGILNDGTAVVCGCTVSNCSGFWGGGIESYGTLAMTNSTVVDNVSQDIAGGLNLGGTTNWLVGCTIAGNQSGRGGGIFNYERELRMLNCTVSGNSASFGGGGIASGPYYGVTNSTIYANYCTIVSNMSHYISTDTAGGGVLNGVGVFDCQNSIIAGNGTNDVSGVLISEGYNLIQNTNGCTITSNSTGNIYGADPLLGPLQDNGGPTWTHALLWGSPAIDAGSSEGGPAVDQRGIPRPQGLAPDIGAFEFQYATPVLVRMAVQSRTNCGVTLCGLRGGSYTFQASTNLVNWFNVATNIADTNGVCEFTEMGAARGSRRFYRVSLPVPSGSVYIPAPSGIVDAPLLITNTYIWQPIDTSSTGLANGGRAEYPFILPRAGSYVLQASVNATNASVNSFYVNIDAEPQDPTMIWDVYPYTSAFGFEQRTVNWRGDGADGADQFVPIVFTLTQGSHKLVIRGREAWTLLRDIAIVPYP